VNSVIAADRAVVCDASVLAAMVFGEPGSAQAHSLTRSKRLLAPSLLRYEMAQTAVKKCTRSPDDAPGVVQAFAASLRVPVRLLMPSWSAVVELARTHRLSAYDASYLQLARELHIRLATLDARLGQAAESLGIRAVPRTD
jgi:predicted nucleic acid-binding protein